MTDLTVKVILYNDFQMITQVGNYTINTIYSDKPMAFFYDDKSFAMEIKHYKTLQEAQFHHDHMVKTFWALQLSSFAFK